MIDDDPRVKLIVRFEIVCDRDGSAQAGAVGMMSLYDKLFNVYILANHDSIDISDGNMEKWFSDHGFPSFPVVNTIPTEDAILLDRAAYPIGRNLPEPHELIKFVTYRIRGK